jgi:GDPmannose 4,6-dehydratase
VTVNPVPGAYYNIGGSFSCTVEDMLKHLVSISSCRDSICVETEQVRLRPLDADLQVPDTTKFRIHTGWEPEIPFEKTMQDLLDYWRERVKTGAYHLVR